MCLHIYVALAVCVCSVVCMWCYIVTADTLRILRQCVSNCWNLHMHIYIYTYMHMYMYTYINTYMYTCITCIHLLHKYIPITCIRIYIHTYIHIDIHEMLHVLPVRTRIHICTYTDIHVYIHFYKYIDVYKCMWVYMFIVITLHICI